MDTVKICSHCRHFRAYSDEKPICLVAQAKQTKMDVVFGTWPQRGAYEMRGNRQLCGPDGRFWEERLQPTADKAEADKIAGERFALWPWMVAAFLIFWLPIAAAFRAAYNAPGIFCDGVVAWWRGLQDKARAAWQAWQGVTDNAKSETADAVAVSEAIDKAEAETVGKDPKPGDTQTQEPVPVPVPDPSPLPQTEGQETPTAPGELVPQTDDKPQLQPPAGALGMALGVVASIAVIALGFFAAEYASARHPNSGLLRPCAYQSQQQTCCTKGNPARCEPCRWPRYYATRL